MTMMTEPTDHISGKLGTLIAIFGTRLRQSVTELRETATVIRHEREIHKMVGVLDRLSDRQLRVLGLDRAFLCTDIEDRYQDMLDKQRKSAPQLSDRSAEAA